MADKFSHYFIHDVVVSAMWRGEICYVGVFGHELGLNKTALI